MRQRSSYPKPFKAQVVQECLKPGASVSSVAISHGINANMIRKWLPIYRDKPVASLPAFVPLQPMPKQLAEQALHSIGGLYEVERQAKDMSDEERWRLRQEIAAPLAQKLHEWMLAQRDLVPEVSATAKALDCGLKRWVALTRYLDDGAVPIDNNPVENTIRPRALGRSN